MQDWPALAVNTPVRVTPRVAAPRSASANTMFGDLPPSSKCNCFRVLAADAMRIRAVSVEPVKTDAGRRRGVAPSASPAISPRPATTLITPGGRPACLEELCPSQDRCAGLLCRLDDDRVAGRQRGGCLGDHERHRRVPRQHEADDPEGLATGEVEARRADVDGVAVQFVGRAGEEVQDLDAHREVPVQRLLDDPAGVGGLEISQLALVDVGDRRKRSEVRRRGPWRRASTTPGRRPTPAATAAATSSALLSGIVAQR